MWIPVCIPCKQMEIAKNASMLCVQALPISLMDKGSLPDMSEWQSEIGGKENQKEQMIINLFKANKTVVERVKDALDELIEDDVILFTPKTEAGVSSVRPSSILCYPSFFFNVNFKHQLLSNCFS